MILFFGLLSLGTGTGLFLWGLLDENPTMRRVALAYLAAGALLLLLRAVLSGFWLRLIRPKEDQETERVTVSAQGGFALLMALALLAVTAGPCLHGALWAQQAVRAAEARCIRTALRWAATDAVAHALKILSEAPATWPASATERPLAAWESPARIRATADAREITAAECAAVLPKDFSGRLALVRGRAEQGGAPCIIYAVAAKTPKEIRLLAWMESP